MKKKRNGFSVCVCVCMAAGKKRKIKWMQCGGVDGLVPTALLLKKGFMTQKQFGRTELLTHERNLLLALNPQTFHC